MEDELSTPVIAKLLKVAPGTIIYCIHKYYIPMRTRREALLLSVEKGRRAEKLFRNVELGQGIAEKNVNWKGGRTKHHSGYMMVYLPRDSFFVPMATKRSTTKYVPEHRLVMAKHLGRCLSRLEIVHHKNGIKDDNRIENLELGGTISEHIVARSKGYRDGYDKGYYDGNSKRIMELEGKIKELEATLGTDNDSNPRP